MDINGKRILVYDPITASTTSMQLSQLVGFAIPTTETRKRKDGTMLYLIVGLEDRVVEINFTDQTIIRTIAEIPADIKENSRFNDGKASPTGLLYAGYMNLKWREGYGGHFFKLNEEHSQFQTLLKPTELGLPNGLAWVSEKKMYVIDSLKNTISMYETSDETQGDKDSQFPVAHTEEITTLGCCSEENKNFEELSVIYKLDAEYVKAGGMLDGMTIDSEGKLWVAIPGCSCILRIDPETQKVIYKLLLPIKKPTAVAFGGPHLESLYITTRNEDASNEPKGLLYRCKIDGIRGMSAGHQIKMSSKEYKCCFLPYLMNAIRF